MGEKLELVCFGWVLIKVFLAVGVDYVALKQTLEHFTLILMFAPLSVSSFAICCYFVLVQ